jgi:hypothetical protein
MLFSDVLLGTVIGAILWPIVQKVVDSMNRAVLGFILGGIVGGALAWAKVGLYAGLVVGSSLGANVTPLEGDIGLIFLDALIQTVRGAAVGAVIVQSIRSISFVITGAGIGLFVSLFISGGLRYLNQALLTDPLTSLQITLVVMIGTFAIIGLLSGRR